jgi:hypothetical protein
MLEDERRVSIRRLCAAPATPLEDAPSRRGRRSHEQLSYDANHLPPWANSPCQDCGRSQYLFRCHISDARYAFTPFSLTSVMSYILLKPFA